MYVWVQVGAGVTRRYAATLGIMCHSVLAHYVASHTWMFECMFVNMSQSTGVSRRPLAMKTCGKELRRGIVAKTCGKDLRRGNSAKTCGEKIGKSCNRVAKYFWRRQTNLRRFRRRSGEEWEKNIRSQNSKAKIIHPRFPSYPDGPFCVAEPPPPQNKKPDPVPGT